MGKPRTPRFVLNSAEQEEKEWTMKVKVDPRLCIGTGVCEQLCPEVFEVKDGISTVKSNIVPAGAEQSCNDAVQGCPMGAISIEP